jgi:hypothetical protein
MYIENTMVTGWGKPDEAMVYAKGIFDDYTPDPVYRCERCKDTLMRNTIVYEWGNDWICEDCMNDAVNSLSPEDRADMVGEEICYTEQMVEMAKTYEDLAELMRLEKAEAWSVL